MARSPRESTSRLQTGGRRTLPFGIKLIAALNVLGALVGFAVVSRIFAAQHPLANVLGVVVVLFVVAGLAFTYGLVTLEYWGWLGTVAFNGLSAVVDLVQFNLLGLAISGFIVYYLLQNEDLYAEDRSA